MARPPRPAGGTAPRLAEGCAPPAGPPPPGPRRPRAAGPGAALGGVGTRGPAAASRIEGVLLAGKTGTAQNAQDPARDHAWFVGFAPANDPKIVVAVMLEFGGHGTRAARIASKIIAHYLKAAPRQLLRTEGGGGSDRA